MKGNICLHHWTERAEFSLAAQVARDSDLWLDDNMLTLITQEETEEGQGNNGNDLAFSPSPWAWRDHERAVHERAGDSSCPQLVLDQWISVSLPLTQALPHLSPHPFIKHYCVPSSVLGMGVTQWWMELFVFLQSHSEHLTGPREARELLGESFLTP